MTVTTKRVTQRVEWIDFAKGIGIILVVYGHVLVGLKGASLGVSEQFQYYSHAIVYSFHMPLFFFIAGLNVFRSMPKNCHINFIFKKINVIIYPYIIWSVLTGSIQIALSNYINSNITVHDLINIWHTPLPNQHYWFLYTLFLMYVTYFLFNKLFKTYSKYIFVLFSVVLLLSNTYTSVRVIDKYTINIIYFSLGILLSKSLLSNKTLLTHKISSLSAAIMALLFLSIEIIYLSNSINYNAIHIKTINLFFANYGIFTIIYLSANIMRFRLLNFLKEIGEYSMVIYLAHSLFGSGARIIISRIFGIDNILIHIIFGMFCGVVFPIVLYKLSLKYKMSFLFKSPEWLYQTIRKNVATK